MKVGSLELGGEARNFGITGDGDVQGASGQAVQRRPQRGRRVGIGVGWPSWLPIQINTLGLSWADFEDHPGDFDILLSASVTGHQGHERPRASPGRSRASRSGRPCCCEGKFPIVAIDALGVSVKGKLFGGELDAALLGGILKLDTDCNIDRRRSTRRPPVRSPRPLPRHRGRVLDGRHGRLHDPARPQRARAAAGVDQRRGAGRHPARAADRASRSTTSPAGVEFFKTLPSIDDPFELREPEFGCRRHVNAADWLTVAEAPGRRCRRSAARATRR